MSLSRRSLLAAMLAAPFLRHLPFAGAESYVPTPPVERPTRWCRTVSASPASSPFVEVDVPACFRRGDYVLCPDTSEIFRVSGVLGSKLLVQRGAVGSNARKIFKNQWLKVLELGFDDEEKSC